MYRLLLLLGLATTVLVACPPAADSTTGDAADTTSADRYDPHSHARPAETAITHLDLDLTVDFAAQVLHGTATYRLRTSPGADTLTLDSKDLDIERVTLDSDSTAVDFTLVGNDKLLGSALHIPIQAATETVTIHYRTSPTGAAALGWLTAAQTLDKDQPFLFTQGQAILTRTWIPIQDSPGIRITYGATIRVPPGLMAVMSAENPQQQRTDGVYTFRMQQSIPPYLIALAVGDLQFRALGERTGVYAEPGMIDRAVYELEDMEKMLAAAESLYGPYDWERYDLIVLPPSFPFGGMENPRLTFATPTIIAGDRSLVSLVAHELAHSWSGNLVTNATWNDFWLNEGFTTYFENRIMEKLYGPDYAQMLAELGYQDLVAGVEDLKDVDTKLYLQLAGRDPDDGMTDIAYEKGAHLLRRLEQAAGRERFDAFLRDYFATYRFQTITTSEFVDYVRAQLIDKYDLSVDIDRWIYQPGLPDDLPRAQSRRFAAVDSLRTRYLEGTALPEATTNAWSTHEWLHFLRQLPTDLTKPRLAALDRQYGLSDSGNSEIKAAWLALAIKSGYGQEVLPAVRNFLTTVGRRKFLMPIYRALHENGLTAEARDIAQIAAPGYHSISRNSVEQLLK